MSEQTEVIIITNEVEAARQQLHEKVCREWKETAPSAVKAGIAPSRILSTLAARHGMSMTNVVKILRRAGIYQGAKSYKREILNQQ